jgi:protein O-mannosyl-transferase
MSTTPATAVFFKKNKWALWVIVALSIGIYAQSIGFDYVLDDTMVIVKNKFTQRGISGISDIFKYESFRGFYGEQKNLLEGDRYRPLSIATFAVEKSLFGGNKAMAHGINILLYALTGILLFKVLLFMFPYDEKHTWYMSIPFMATVLYMVHPLHSEVVANVKGRDDIIAFMGEMGVLYFSFRYLNNNKLLYLILSFTAFLIGILSKESAITFLAIVPLTAHFFTQASLSQKFKISIPIIVGTLVYLIMRFNAIGYLTDNKVVTDLMNNPFYNMSWGEKTATIFYTFFEYLKLLVFPHPLTHDYYPYQIPIAHWSEWRPIVALLLHIGLLAVILRGWQTKSIWAYAAAFYVITFSIVSNIFVSVGTFMNERFMYHASLGFCLAVAYFLHNHFNINILYSKSKKYNIWVLVLFVLITMVYSIITILRVPDWRSNQTLNEAAIIASPNSARANCFYAISIWENSYKKLNNDASPERTRAVLDSMQHYFDAAVRILPSYKAAHGMRGAVAAEYHKLDNNYDTLLQVFEEASRSGVYQQFIFDYLDFIVPRVDTKANGEKLLGYLERMLVYYQQNFGQTKVPDRYQSYIDMVRGRLPSLR